MFIFNIPRDKGLLKCEQVYSSYAILTSANIAIMRVHFTFNFIFVGMIKT
jgi:hypothetical protein